MKRLTALLLCIVFASFTLSCTENEKESGKSDGGLVPNNTQAPSNTEQLKARGKSVYASACLACHNIDPSKDGAIGPAISGSSFELLTARVMRASYPDGYKPKKETRTMVALPHLEKELPALFEYLK